MRRCLELFWLPWFVAACAASPVVDFPEGPSWVEPEPEPEPEGAAPEEEPDEEPDDESDDGAPADAASSTASATAPLASADAGGPTTGDGGVRDAAGPAGQDAGRDAGATRPSALPPLPGGLDLGTLSPPRARACTVSKDCTVSCFPVGLVSCCRPDHICGCSWAPGAYCL